MGAYRWDDFTNPALFVSGVEMMLEQYPDCVIENMTSPRCGLQTESVRPPGQAEIRARCDNSLRSYKNIALNVARKARAAEAAKTPKPSQSDAPKVDLIKTHPFFSRDAVERRLSDPFAALKKLAAAAGRTLTDEEIAAIPDSDVERWKKLKAS